MTTQFTPPIRRKKWGRGHVYVDAHDKRVPGVTTLVNDGVPKPALANYTGNQVAAYATNHWDELGDMPIATRLKTLEDAKWADRDAAANRGTEVHALAEKLLHGQQVTVPDELAGHVDSYVRFLDEWEPTPVIVESVVVNYTHGYAGTLDSILDIDHPLLGRTLADIKTNRSGIYGDIALQLSAYRYAERYISEIGEQPMIAVDTCAAIHVRSDGYSLIPVTAGPAQFRAFLYAVQVARFRGSSRELVGDELTPNQ